MRPESVLHQTSPPKLYYHLVATFRQNISGNDITELLRDLRENEPNVLHSAHKRPERNSIFICVGPIEETHLGLIIGDLEDVDPLVKIKREEMTVCDGRHLQ